jgi:hypothetical protein
MTDIQKLKALAEAATHGEWTCGEKPEGRFWQIGCGSQAIGATHSASKKQNPEYAAMFEANARYIAAANPAALLDMVAEVEQLRAVNFDLHAGQQAMEEELGALRKDAYRYRWLRDKSEAVHSFYLSVPIWFKNVIFQRADVDSAIDNAMAQEQQI